MKRPFLFVVLIAALCVFALSVAHADGPGGSSEHHGRCTTTNPDGSTTVSDLGPGTDGSDCPSGSTGETTYDNDVSCGSNTAVAGFDVFVGASGVELCNEGGAPAPQGRIMASGDPANQSGYVGADGDKDNSPSQAQGFIGLSSETGTPVACADADGNHDLSHGTSDDDVNDCAP